MSRRPRQRRKRPLHRRTVLKGMTALGVLSATAPLLSCGTGDSGPEDGSSPQAVTVYRFQTQPNNTCKACRTHQHYKVFLDPVTANGTRAHAGCNCAIVAQQMPLDYWATIEPFAIAGSIDLRAVVNAGALSTLRRR